jgi:regulation of enolase protein 1 (concanavalin A-like superfamily)
MTRAAVTLCLSLTALAALAAPVPKPKDGAFAQPGWDRRIDPDKGCKFTRARDTLTVEVPAKDHDLDGRRSRVNAPCFVRDVAGDFRAEVRVKGDFHASEKSTATSGPSYSAGGLVVRLADEAQTLIRFELGAARVEGKKCAYLALKELQAKSWGGALTTLYDTREHWPLKAGAKQAHLRLELKGRWFTASCSADGQTWKHYSGVAVARPPAKFKVGVIACNTSNGRLEVTFDRFKLTRPAKGK